MDAASSTHPDGGPACGAYFDALFGRCSSLSSDPSEVARLRSIFLEICSSDLQLPGTGMTVAGIESCTTALDIQDCQSAGLAVLPPVACVFTGSLPLGTPCNEDFQCMSGFCTNYPIGCAKCSVRPTLGQPCDARGCAGDATCINSVCVAVARLDAEKPCSNASVQQCNPGLYCAYESGVCAPLVAEVGAACGAPSSVAPGAAPGGCQPPLECVGSPLTCAQGQSLPAGSQCSAAFDCAPGLGCVFGSGNLVGPTHCQPLTWAGSGEPCDGTTRQCLVGACSNGICPAVIPDGLPCDVADASKRCDTLSQCFQNRCVRLDSVVCR
jgi:hypothetical protein